MNCIHICNQWTKLNFRIIESDFQCLGVNIVPKNVSENNKYQIIGFRYLSAYSHISIEVASTDLGILWSCVSSQWDDDRTV